MYFIDYNIMNLLYPLQHGFRSGNSTVMRLLDIHNQITKAIDANKILVGILLDLSKKNSILLTTGYKFKNLKIMGFGVLLFLGLETTYPLKKRRGERVLVTLMARKALECDSIPVCMAAKPCV